MRGPRFVRGWGRTAAGRGWGWTAAGRRWGGGVDRSLRACRGLHLGARQSVQSLRRLSGRSRRVHDERASRPHPARDGVLPCARRAAQPERAAAELFAVRGPAARRAGPGSARPGVRGCGMRRRCGDRQRAVTAWRCVEGASRGWERAGEGFRGRESLRGFRIEDVFASVAALGSYACTLQSEAMDPEAAGGSMQQAGSTRGAGDVAASTGVC
jgi:hypothetical protein